MVFIEGSKFDRVVGLLKIKTLFCAFVFVLPLYLMWFFDAVFNTTTPIFLNTIFSLCSLYIFLSVRDRFLFGFYVGLFWFYWIGFSFVYFGFAYLVPLISLFVAIVYALIIYFALFFQNIFYRGAMFLLLSFIHPFGFDWFVLDSFFAYSFFGVGKLELFFVVCGFWFLWFYRIHFVFIFASLICFTFALDFSSPNVALPNLKINIANTNFSQDFKWRKENMAHIVDENLRIIRESIDAKYDVVLLPETSFPFLLEDSYILYDLLKYSEEITILTGALRSQDGKIFNSNFVFENGSYKSIDKVILAPFGEKIPLPEFLSKFVSKIFFGNGGIKFAHAESFGDFVVDGVKFRSAICYEGTSRELYEDNPQYIVVTSNNAWFRPSIEPILQKILMKYYSRLHKSVIFHSSNGSKSFMLN